MTRVKVSPGRQVVDEHGHHYEDDELDVAEGTARQWVSLGWVTRVDTEQPPATGYAVSRGRANVRERIRLELQTDPSRSNRAVADVVGCDHKTVATVRREIEGSDDAA